VASASLANSFVMNADNAVIRNGTITGFAFGIALSGAFDVTVKNMRLVGNDRGMFLDHSGRARVLGGVLGGNVGLAAQDASANGTIRGVKVTGGRDHRRVG
jgi:hypothetical protein